MGNRRHAHRLPPGGKIAQGGYESTGFLDFISAECLLHESCQKANGCSPDCQVKTLQHDTRDHNKSSIFMVNPDLGIAVFKGNQT